MLIRSVESRVSYLDNVRHVGLLEEDYHALIPIIARHIDDRIQSY